jgi:hypothetical protein
METKVREVKEENLIATEYQEFTWQAIKALADKIGVHYYAQYDYMRSGIGFKANRRDLSQIRITGHVSSSGQNKHDSDTIQRLSWKCFEQTLELYFLKNNIKYELVKPERHPRTGEYREPYIHIFK